MKIAIIVPLFPPKRLGGLEISTYNIAKYLVKKGHEVHVITTLDEGLPKESKEGGFCVHRLSWQKVRFLGILSFWIKIFWLLKKINPDVVHVQSIGIGVPAVFAKKILKNPYVVYGRGSDVYLSYRFKKMISKLVLKNAEAVIALTEDMKREIKRIVNRNIFVIPNGIDLDKFKNLAVEENREKLKIKEDEKIILSVGTLRPVKGIKYLIAAMRLIKDKNKNTRLMLVGDGEDRGELQSLVEELNLEADVTFIGKVPNKKVPEYMTASDVFVLPSLSEGFPMVLLEGMASGLPIVATNIGAIREIIKDGENGFLVESKNSEEIAEKVLLLLRDNSLRQWISENNKEKMKQYSLVYVIERLEEIYQNLL